MNPLPLPQNPSILVIKMSAMGDLIQALPCVTVLRNFTGGRITWVVDAGLAGLLRGNPEIENVLEFPRDPYAPATLASGSFRIGRRLLGQLRSQSFDLAIDFQGLVRSWLVLGLARAGTKIARGSYPFSDFRFPHRRGVPRHAALACFELLAPLGIPRPASLAHVEPPRLDPSASLGSSNSNRICLLPFTTWPSKHWTPSSWGTLADWLLVEGFAVTLIGSPGDLAESRHILAAMAHASRLENLVGKLSLPELKKIFSDARLVVGVDTGPLHVAAAMACPTVALFAGSDPARTAPWPGNRNRIIQAPDCRSCCRRHCRQRCLQRLPVEGVISAVSRCLETTGTVTSKQDSKPGGFP